MRNEALWINMEEYKWANRDVSNSPDDEVVGEINPVKSRVPSLSKIFYYKITTNITQNMLGYAVICIPQMAKIDDFTR